MANKDKENSPVVIKKLQPTRSSRRVADSNLSSKANYAEVDSSDSETESTVHSSIRARTGPVRDSEKQSEYVETREFSAAGSRGKLKSKVASTMDSYLIPSGTKKKVMR